MPVSASNPAMSAAPRNSSVPRASQLRFTVCPYSRKVTLEALNFAFPDRAISIPGTFEGEKILMERREHILATRAPPQLAFIVAIGFRFMDREELTRAQVREIGEI